ncbi:hypothetical protein I4F81_000549 [Pyropia yezoensis]|uniref:Uncharacterized protein n=1 Tax=Pyropia yezoensis TaxID=2788 RepID=A0ACC3BJ03_PYRYE|nr:hypothetical protein I4F81_000549 [Neopyropia yezoensis]
MPRRAGRRVSAAKARLAVARDEHPDVLRTVFDVADEAVASFRRLALEAHGLAYDGSEAGPARTRRKVELRNPGRFDLLTAVKDAVLDFLRRAASRASTTRGKLAPSDSAKGAGERATDAEAAASGGASDGGSRAVPAQLLPRSVAVDDEEEGEAGGAGAVRDDAPLARNPQVMTRIGFFLPEKEAGSAPEGDNPAGRVTKSQPFRRIRLGARRGAMEDLNRRVAEETAKVQHLLLVTNNLAALLRTDVPNVASTGGPCTGVGPVRVSRESDATTPVITQALSTLAGMYEKLLTSHRSLQTVSDQLAQETRRNEELHDSFARVCVARQGDDDYDSLQGSDESDGRGDGSGGRGGVNEPTAPESGSR